MSFVVFVFCVVFRIFTLYNELFVPQTHGILVFNTKKKEQLGKYIFIKTSSSLNVPYQGGLHVVSI